MNKLCCCLSNDPRVSSYNTIKVVVKSRFATFCMSYFVCVVRHYKAICWDRTLGQIYFFLIQAKVLKHLRICGILDIGGRSKYFPLVFTVNCFTLFFFFKLWFPLFIYVRSNTRPTVDARSGNVCVCAICNVCLRSNPPDKALKDQTQQGEMVNCM